MKNILFSICVLSMANPSMAYFYTPAYVDNSKCLTGPDTICYNWQATREVNEEYLYTEGFSDHPSTRESNVWTFFWEKSETNNSFYKNYLNGYPNVRAENSPGYAYKINNLEVGVFISFMNERGERLPENQDLYCGSIKADTENGDYEAALGRGSSKSLRCEIKTGWNRKVYGVYTKTFSGSATIINERWDFNASSIILPALRLVAYGERAWHSSGNPGWTGKVIKTISLVQRRPIRLNERRCYIKVDNQDSKVLTYDLIKAWDNRNGLLQALPTKLSFGCIGGHTAEVDGRVYTISGVNITNKLYSLKIDSTTPYPDGSPSSFDGIPSAISLKTNNKKRDDLYVEPSWDGSSPCGINGLLTNGSLVDFRPEDTDSSFNHKSAIVVKSSSHAPKAEMSATQLPTLWWKLCRVPGKKLIPGDFEGTARVTIIYN